MKKSKKVQKNQTAADKEYQDLLYLAKIFFERETGEQAGPVFNGQKNRTVSAEDFLLKAIREYPEREQAYLDLCEIYVVKDELKSAQTILEHGFSIQPASERIGTWLAEIHLCNYEWKSALDVADQVLAFSAGHVPALYAKGLALYFLRDFNKSIECLKLVCEDQPDEFEPHLHIAKSFIALANFDAAISYLELADILSSNNPDVMFLLGVSWHEQKNFYLARDYFRRAEACGVSSPKLFGLLGKCEAALGDWLAASRQFGKASMIEPNNFELAACLGIALQKINEWKDAITVLEHADQLQRDQLDVLNSLYECYWNLNKKKKIAEILLRIEKLHERKNKRS